MTDLFNTKVENPPGQMPVQTALSQSELGSNAALAMAGDGGAKSVQHVERPRYGHKV